MYFSIQNIQVNILWMAILYLKVHNLKFWMTIFQGNFCDSWALKWHALSFKIINIFIILVWNNHKYDDMLLNVHITMKCDYTVLKVITIWLVWCCILLKLRWRAYVQNESISNFIVFSFWIYKHWWSKSIMHSFTFWHYFVN